MFAIPGIVALLAFILARPFDFVPALRSIPFLYIFFALAVFGILVDARLGYIKLRAIPALVLVLCIVGWCLTTMALMAPDRIIDAAVALAIAVALYLVVGEGVQSFRALETVAVLILVCTTWISFVCVHQGLQPTECVAVEQKEDHSAMGTPDGRECDTVEICYVDPPEPQAIYRCEHAGILGITSIGNGRVRYVGVLHDPNEVALTVAMSLPLAIGIYHRRRTRLRLTWLIAFGILSVATVILSKSRGGLLVFATVVGVYFLRRYGKPGAIAAGVLALPVLLLGGRSGDKASSSTTERIETWYEGIEMLRAYPLTGVGHDQFVEHHHLTAHNSLLLSAAENGLVGAVLWTALMYLTLKIPLAVLKVEAGPEGEIARSWAMALLASLAGMVVGTIFLTFNYHYVLWIHVGLAIALWSATKRHRPDFEVPFGWLDGALVVMIAGGMLGGIYAMTRIG